MTQPVNILLVDDDQSLTRTIGLILERQGYAVSTAGSGLEAIERIREEAFDLAFVDIKMPGLDGVETLCQLKSLRRDLTVVMMTAYTVEQRVREALEAGAHGVLHKPFDVKAVLSLIRRAVSTSGEMLILLVEDDPGTRRTLKNILAHRGYRVGEAASGKCALELVRDNHYDVVLLDLRLPDMNGVETYLAIRALDPKVAVIMITAYRAESHELVHEALSLSVLECLDKPLEMAQVLRSIEAARPRVEP